MLASAKSLGRDYLQNRGRRPDRRFPDAPTERGAYRKKAKFRLIVRAIPRALSSRGSAEAEGTHRRIRGLQGINSLPPPVSARSFSVYAVQDDMQLGERGCVAVFRDATTERGGYSKAGWF
jgi:hypothetical protein